MAISKHQNSFTLLELLIVASFIILFTGFSIGYYNQFTEQKKLENAGQKMRSTLDLSRSRTLSGDSSGCGGTNARVESYGMEITESSSYSIVPHCIIGTPSPMMYRNEVNVVFPNVPISVSFFPITGGAECQYIYIKNTVLNGGNGSCRYIKVSSTGLTSEDSCETCDLCPNTCP